MTLSITKPTVGGSEDTWGTTINTALDDIVSYANTAPQLGDANVFTAAQTVSANFIVDTNVLFVDASNNRVGIGTASPGVLLDVQATGDVTARVKANSSGAGNDDDAILRLDAAETGEADIQFYLDGADVGYSISAAFPLGQLNYNVGSGGTHDFQVGGTLIGRFEDTGSTEVLRVGAGGATSQAVLQVASGTNSSHYATISQYNGDDLDINAPGGAVRLQGAFGNSTGFFATTTVFGPSTDNLYDLGSGSFRYDDVYATNGTIQTSDIRQKQDIEELNEAELRVAMKAKTLLRKYRWKDAVIDKGDDARIHIGIMAQDLIRAFDDEGLDAFRYAMIVGNEEDGYGVRYHELLAFIIAAW